MDIQREKEFVSQYHYDAVSYTHLDVYKRQPLIKVTQKN